jgi:ABC-type multidrug transport system ATPase subunit
MDLTLGVGKIYGLLGASGCGKTTFLKCLLGRLAIHGGTLNVLGKPYVTICYTIFIIHLTRHLYDIIIVFDRPGAPGHDVPGRDVGFMPQETALYMQFSIHEVLAYYARLHGLTEEFFQERKKFLMEFLELPDEDRLVVNLSGGQQRRVSLCVALLHNPRLVILDEPTVGVDPLLRARIWEYLVQIAQGGTSIIITTHYIEEARQAHTVGLMRDGKLLDEGQPDYLMKKYGKASLEETFLMLCHIQEREKSGLPALPGTPNHARNGNGHMTPPATPPTNRRGSGTPSTGGHGRRDSAGSMNSDDFSQPLMPVTTHSSRAVQHIDVISLSASYPFLSL